MRRKITKSWETLWTLGTQAGATHWNYSRGLVRFRRVRKQPAALRVEDDIDSDAIVRVRFYLQDGGQFVEQEGIEVFFQPPPIEDRILPPDFRTWPRERQRAHLKDAIPKLSAIRGSPERTKAVGLLISTLETFQEHLLREDQLEATMAKAAAEQPARINNFWEFLQHPNAERGLSAVIFALTQNKELTETLTDNIKMLPALKAAGLRDLAKIRLTPIYECAIYSPDGLHFNAFTDGAFSCQADSAGPKAALQGRLQRAA
ncbi:MAG TPA: hypothetical protein DCQ33_15305 [Nitrospira sp.]|nr:hypothetical protein [Nitrospira sp.]